MSKKKATGIVLDKDVIDWLDSIKKECVDLGVTRSELINNVLIMYKSSDIKREKKMKSIRKHIIKIRKGLI